MRFSKEIEDLHLTSYKMLHLNSNSTFYNASLCALPLLVAWDNYICDPYPIATPMQVFPQNEHGLNMRKHGVGLNKPMFGCFHSIYNLVVCIILKECEKLEAKVYWNPPSITNNNPTRNVVSSLWKDAYMCSYHTSNRMVKMWVILFIYIVSKMRAWRYLGKRAWFT